MLSLYQLLLCSKIKFWCFNNLFGLFELLKWHTLEQMGKIAYRACTRWADIIPTTTLVNSSKLPFGWYLCCATYPTNPGPLILPPHRSNMTPQYRHQTSNFIYRLPYHPPNPNSQRISHQYHTQPQPKLLVAHFGQSLVRHNLFHCQVCISFTHAEDSKKHTGGPILCFDRILYTIRP